MKVLRLILLSLVLKSGVLLAGKALIREELREIATYPFTTPDRVPLLISRPYIYPYFKFNGYTKEKVLKKWKVVVLENDYIRVEILPEVGGKILGAVEKSTGYDFIYKNDAIKFRNIAMRGPWTSGGIEFNFGIQGHTPATATPVDYALKEYPDGSVSCTVGTLDLPSRTEWRMEIRLSPEKAYFELLATWYNPTALPSSYYYWGNAAVRARPDARFYYPGSHHIGHSGDVHPWPVDQADGDQSWYRNHVSGGNKTFHILGDNENYKGIYYHDLDVGAVSWSLKQDLPGKKLWFWSPAPSGGIWEELLTDGSGQYIEIQSGRLFNQANEKSGRSTPFRQNVFMPYQMDTWKEVWAPVVKTGGIKAMAPEGILNVTRKDGRIFIVVQALEQLDTHLTVSYGGKIYASERVKLLPVQVKTFEMEIAEGTAFRVSLEGTDLNYSSAKEQDLNERPLIKPDSVQKLAVEQVLTEAEEHFRHRAYDEALSGYLKYLKERPSTSLALNRVAGIYYRMNQYEKALHYLNSALSADTYDPDANFIYAQVQRARKRYSDCFLALGIAARMPAYAVAANTLAAEIYLETGNDRRAMEFAKKALAAQAGSVPALKLLIIASRRMGDRASAENYIAALLEQDPLNHFARYEKIFLDDTPERRQQFRSAVHTEFADQVYFELAAFYWGVGLKTETVQVLKEIAEHPEASIWLAVLDRVHSEEWMKKALAKGPDWVFPYRRETEAFLEQAAHTSSNWKIRYYSGLLKWGLGKKQEALEQLKSCQNQPEYAPFYLTRGILKEQMGIEGKEVAADYKMALANDPDEPLAYEKLTEYMLENGQLEEASGYAREAAHRFPGQYTSVMNYAAILLYEHRYEECFSLLSHATVLPKEGGTLSHDLYTLVCWLQALNCIDAGKYTQAISWISKAREWPRDLGVGEPFHPDYRISNYLMAYCLAKSGKKHVSKSQEHYRAVVGYKVPDGVENKSINGVLAVWALEKLGEKSIADQRNTALKTAVADRRFVDWLNARENGDQSKQQLLERAATKQYDLRAGNLQFYVVSRIGRLK